MPGLVLAELRKEHLALAGRPPQRRGYDFEVLLNRMFEAHGLKPRKPFRLKGEQIDGSFELDGVTYLVEAKFQATPVDRAQLAIFADSVGKAEWSRGVYLSDSGFSPDGLTALSRHRRVSFVCMDGLDLHDILSGSVSFQEAIRAKVRRAAEDGEMFVRVRDLFPRVSFD